MPLQILLVDDHPAICEILTLELAGVGHLVTACLRLDEALAALARETFDLIVADFSLDDATAVDLLAAVDPASAQPRPKCYIFSGYPQAELEGRFCGLQVDRFYLKPVAFNALLEDIASDFKT